MPTLRIFFASVSTRVTKAPSLYRSIAQSLNHIGGDLEKTYRRLGGDWFHGSMVLWFHGSMVPWFHGAMDLWIHGSMAPWLYGSMALWLHGTTGPTLDQLWTQRPLDWWRSYHHLPSLTITYHLLPSLTITYHLLPTLTITYHHLPSLTNAQSPNHPITQPPIRPWTHKVVR